MAIDPRLGSELKTYTINLLNSIGKDVDRQIDKWSKPHVGFLSMLCAAYQRAVDNQTETFKESDEERRRSFERAIFSLELLSLGAFAWLGASLELKVGPRIFYEYEMETMSAGAVTIISKLKKVHNEFASKVLGDAGADLAKFGFDLAKEKILQPVAPKEMDAKKVTLAPDFNVFGDALYQQVDAQQTAIQDNINRITEVMNTTTFSDTLVKRLQLEQGFKQLNGFAAQFVFGQQLVNRLLTLMRDVWADKWLYYGNDPPTPQWSKVTRELERQLWALWILQQRFHVEPDQPGTFSAIHGASGPVLNDDGFAHDSPITTRLVETFNAPLQDYLIGNGGIIWDWFWCKREADQLNTWAVNQGTAWLDRELNGKKRLLRPIDHLWS